MRKILVITAIGLLVAAVMVWAADEYADYYMGTTANNPHGMRKITDDQFPLPLTGLSRSMPGDSACTSSTFGIHEFVNFTTCWEMDTTLGPKAAADKESVYLGIYFQISQDGSAFWTFDSTYDTTGGADYMNQKCKVWTTKPSAPYGRFIYAGQTRTRTAAAGAESQQSDSIVLGTVYHTMQQ